VKNLKNIFNELRKECFLGKFINLSKIKKCDYYYCERPVFANLDDLICFARCTHFYHKFCFERMNDTGNSEKPIVEGMVLEKPTNTIYKITQECKICSKII
jgi:hypothetical protein